MYFSYNSTLHYCNFLPEYLGVSVVLLKEREREHTHDKLTCTYLRLYAYIIQLLLLKNKLEEILFRNYCVKITQYSHVACTAFTCHCKKSYLSLPFASLFVKTAGNLLLWVRAAWQLVCKKILCCRTIASCGMLHCHAMQSCGSGISCDNIATLAIYNNLKYSLPNTIHL